MRQRVVRHERRDVAQLGGFRLQEFAPRRHAVENVGDADGRSRRHTRRLYSQDLATREFDSRSLLFLRGARFKQQSRNSGNRGQRFAAESERVDGKQVVGGPQLRRGVALEGQ